MRGRFMTCDAPVCHACLPHAYHQLPPIDCIVKPRSRLVRTPKSDGTTATFTGTLSGPTRVVTPAAIASPKPPAERLGPTPNSAPLFVRTPISQLVLGRKAP